MAPRDATYASDPINAFIEYMGAVQKLLFLSMDAIAMNCSMPQLFEVLGIARGNKPALEELRKNAELAKKECESGFPLLHEFTLVGMWGALEAVVEDIVVAILANEPERLRAEPFSKIRVPLAEFAALDTDE